MSMNRKEVMREQMMTVLKQMGFEVKVINMNHLSHNDLASQGESSQSESPLKRPVNHNLIEIFKALKFGRPAASQKYLDKCIKELEEQKGVYE